MPLLITSNVNDSEVELFSHHKPIYSAGAILETACAGHIEMSQSFREEAEKLHYSDDNLTELIKTSKDGKIITVKSMKGLEDK